MSDSDAGEIYVVGADGIARALTVAELRRARARASAGAATLPAPMACDTGDLTVIDITEWLHDDASP